MTIPEPAVSSKRKRAPASRLGASDLAEIPEDAELVSTKRAHLDGNDDIDHDSDVDIDAPVAKGKGKGKGKGRGGGLSTTTTTTSTAASKPSLARMESVGDGRSAFRRIIADDKTASQMIDELYQTPEEPIDALEIDLGLDSASISRSASQDATASANASATTTAATTTASSDVEHAAPIAVPVADPATDYWSFFPEPLTTFHPPAAAAAAAAANAPELEPTNDLYLHTMGCKCVLPHGMERLETSVGGAFAEIEPITIPVLDVSRPEIRRDWNWNYDAEHREQDTMSITDAGDTLESIEYNMEKIVYQLPNITAKSINKELQEVAESEFDALIERDPYYTREIHIPFEARYENHYARARQVYLREYNNDEGALIAYPMDKLKKQVIESIGWRDIKNDIGLQLHKPSSNDYDHDDGDGYRGAYSLLLNVDSKFARKYFRFFLRPRPGDGLKFYSNMAAQDAQRIANLYELVIFLRTDILMNDMRANPGTFDTEELRKLLNHGVSQRLYQEAVDSFSTATLPSTLDMIETPAAPGFALKLHDYQARTLTWMSTIESPVSPAARQLQYFDYSELNTLISEDQRSLQHIGYSVRDEVHAALGWFRIIQLGPDGPFYDLLTGQTMSEQQYSAIRAKSVECRGGILADNTGTGKTVTMLAHIHANPMRSVNDINEKEALSYEAQGIARAHRMGVTHPVRVVRFVVRDTVEEQIARRRMPELASKEDVFIPEKPHLRAGALAAAATAADTSSS
ncbi:hypothetical protein GQ42DRAFT_154178 [Ramicandelaber brevisporus]|nr:hypothetical protein GQ42DRAFT_154178 [Ramicandelaber brevisporus]